jgi:Rps23 Pro-64 3,4-dihydroxylase Tpa1-like proline 4-hydroxylase
MPPDATESAMPHRILASWLGGDEPDRLLSYAIAEEARFKETKVVLPSATKAEIDRSLRRSRVLRDLGPFDRLLRTRAQGLQPMLEAEFGMSHTPPGDVEIELVAHGDGSFYRPHIDTFTGDSASGGDNRRLSLVYYLHRRPPAFSGGRLRLLSLRGGEPLAIEPAHDTLLAFPSFLPHEVEPVSIQRQGFENCRFAVNIWLLG